VVNLHIRRRVVVFIIFLLRTQEYSIVSIFCCRVAKRDNAIINRLNKTKVEKQVDFRYSLYRNIFEKRLENTFTAELLRKYYANDLL
jgi:hypothetical protein